MSDAEPSMSSRYEALRKSFDDAVEASGADPGGITFVAVSKRQPLAGIKEAYKLGLRHFGENQIQEAEPKVRASPDGIIWHLVGHLQKNKVRRAVKLFPIIHSIDSLSLLHRVNDIAGQERVCPEVLLQVNLALDPDKHGFHPDAVMPVLESALIMKNLKCTGLMGVPPEGSDAEKAGEYFQGMAELVERFRSVFPQWPGKLSMGMSDDFELAVAKGSNFVRVGSALFGQRQV